MSFLQNAKIGIMIMLYGVSATNVVRGAMMHDTIFREYDIRGKVGTELLIEEMYDLTCAIAYYMRQQSPHLKTVAVGMDGRIHSAAMRDAMCKALSDSGIDVVRLGMCTSPALYFGLHTMPVDGGLMITASHNAKEYNGIKICAGTRSVWGKEIAVIRDYYKERKKIETAHRGSITDYDIIEPYCAWLADNFSHIKGLDIAAVIDCGNGAAGTVMPLLVKKMEWPQVQLLYADVDGTYPHHEADPTVEKNMADVKQLLATTELTVGMGLDGDCDRMAAMTKGGMLVPGDQLLALFAQSIVADNPGACVVYDIKSSGGLSEIVHQWGGVAVMSPAGHAIVKECMYKHHALLGGELSCHFFFKDRYFGFDDGVYALLRLMERLQVTGKTLHEAIAFFPQKKSSREFRIFCEDERKLAVVDAVRCHFEQREDIELVTIDGVRVAFANGWGIVRPSNTQPALSIRFEGNTIDDLQHVKNEFVIALQPHMPDTPLALIFNE